MADAGGSMRDVELVEGDERAGRQRTPPGRPGPRRGTLHHIELWVPSIERATASWGWLLAELGYKPFQDWPGGRSWSLSSTYIVIEQSPDMLPGEHERTRPGLNHLAFHAGDRGDLETLTAAAPVHGWTLMFPDTHPYAGGPDHYAAYLTDTDGYEAELVARGT